MAPPPAARGAGAAVSGRGRACGRESLRRVLHDDERPAMRAARWWRREARGGGGSYRPAGAHEGIEGAECVACVCVRGGELPCRAPFVLRVGRERHRPSRATRGCKSGLRGVPAISLTGSERIAHGAAASRGVARHVRSTPLVRRRAPAWRARGEGPQSQPPCGVCRARALTRALLVHLVCALVAYM